jgi:hypothetical protein
MKTIKVKIVGKTPLLMNKYNVEAELERQAGRRTTKKYVPSEEAEKGAYWETRKNRSDVIPKNKI